ncbi:tektin-3-like [Paramacrobiotus metropolitanus]|uniref:tektin-3-like n=1 Tax=Paramacrobiotus metropolitanus TaxID=2943436 RepID=UPI0024456FC8|nr:tektin-3-like [Paramacrobiotus metropolitanus]XP_055354060.1 tektin-3-like [Paramacrobiotus metropolitanus]
MRDHHQYTLGCTLRNGECVGEAVPEALYRPPPRNCTLLQHGQSGCSPYGDGVNYGRFGPLTQSGVYPHSTEYQLAYNRGPLSPLQTVYPRSWTYKPHWSTASLANSDLLSQLPVPDRLRFSLDNPFPQRLPPATPTMASNMTSVDNLITAKRDASVPQWMLRDPYRVNLLDTLNEDPTRLKATTLRMCQQEHQLINNKESDVKQKLGERVNDVNFWRREIVAEAEKMETEIRAVDRLKQRIDREIQELEGPLKVSLDCTGVRRLKLSGNAIIYLDTVDYELSKEQELISNTRDNLRHVSAALQAQNGRNRVALDELYRDSANKHTALSIDHRCYSMHHTSPEVRAYPGIETFDNTISTPQSWAQMSNNLVLRAQSTRAESNRLRQDAEQQSKKTDHDLWLQWSRVNEALRVKIRQLEEFSRQLHHRYTIVNQELCDLMRDADLLKRNIEDKRRPLQLAQTRLQWRSHRPYMENCYDPPHQGLRDELGDIHGAVERLQKQLKDVEISLNNLNYTKVALEQEIRATAEAIHRDRDRCLAPREAYPVPFRPVVV